MFTLQVDLGQILIVSVLSVTGFLVKRELSSISNRLNDHDARIYGLMGDVKELIGSFRAFQISQAAKKNYE